MNRTTAAIASGVLFLGAVTAFGEDSPRGTKIEFKPLSPVALAAVQEANAAWRKMMPALQEQSLLIVTSLRTFQDVCGSGPANPDPGCQELVANTTENVMEFLRTMEGTLQDYREGLSRAVNELRPQLRMVAGDFSFEDLDEDLNRKYEEQAPLPVFFEDLFDLLGGELKTDLEVAVETYEYYSSNLRGAESAIAAVQSRLRQAEVSGDFVGFLGNDETRSKIKEAISMATLGMESQPKPRGSSRILRR